MYMGNKHIKIIGKTIGLFVVVLLIVWINKWAIGSDLAISLTEKFGYVGAFLSSFLSGFNVIVPIPIIGFYPFFVEAGLNPFVVIILVSLGMVGGDILGYFIGNVGRDVWQEKKKHNKFFKKIESIHNKYPKSLLFILFIYASFIPFPNELIVVPMAFLGYKFRHMIPLVMFGNVVFNTLVAFGFMQINNF